MTDEQKKLANDVVAYYKERGGISTTIDQIHNHFVRELRLRDNDVRYIIGMLHKKDILEQNDGTIHSRQSYFLTDRGWTYENYDKLLEEEAEKRNLEKKQMQSVIDTNKAVQDNLASQSKFNNRSLLMAAASVLFIVISTILELCNTTDKELQGIKIELQNSSRTLDSIRTSHKSLDSAMKIFVDRSYVIPVNSIKSDSVNLE